VKTTQKKHHSKEFGSHRKTAVIKNESVHYVLQSAGTGNRRFETLGRQFLKEEGDIAPKRQGGEKVYNLPAIRKNNLKGEDVTAHTILK